MSQYPSSQFPYTPPPAPRPDWSGITGNPLAPARLAGVLQIALGCALTMMGTCFAAATSMLSPDQLVKQMQSQNPAVELPQVPAEALKTAIFMSGALVLLAGVALIVMGIVVRRGGRVAAAISLGLNGLVGLFLLLGILRCLEEFSGNAVGAIFALMIVGSMSALCGATIAKLMESFRARVNIPTLPPMPYWMAGQQSAGGYGPAGGDGGLGYPPPPPAGAAPVGSSQPAEGKSEIRSSKSESNSKSE